MISASPSWRWLPDDVRYPVLVGASHQVDEVSGLHCPPEAGGDVGDLNTLARDLSVTDDGNEMVTALTAGAHPGAHRPGGLKAPPQPGGDQVIHQLAGSGISSQWNAA
jgi:hypothetical protein